MFFVKSERITYEEKIERLIDNAWAEHYLKKCGTPENHTARRWNYFVYSNPNKFNPKKVEEIVETIVYWFEQIKYATP